MSRVLVTGGAGYIGAHVVRELAGQGHEAIVLDDLRSSREERVGSFPFERVALENLAGVVDVFRRRRPETVIHMAGSISVGESMRDPDKYWRNNFEAPKSLLAAAAEYPIARFVFSSTAAVYGDAEVLPIPESAPLRPTSPYGASKLAFERLLCRAAPALRFSAVALRYFNACGARPEWGVGEAHEPEEHLIPRVIRALRQGEPIQINGRDFPTRDGTCVRDFVHVADLARAHVAVLGAELPPWSAFNVGTGVGFSVLEVVVALLDRLGLESPIRFGPRRPGDPASLVSDAGALQAATGWSARHGLDEIVATAIDWELARNPGRPGAAPQRRIA